MRVVVVYKTESDHARTVFDYLRDFKNPDSAAGSDFCRTYDIVEYPTIIALSDGGQLQNMWRGTPLPTISEVSFYV